MKLYKLVALSIFLISATFSVNGQVVTFEPSFATQNDSLIIVFDATQGDKGLEGFTGDVFLHTGLITSKSTGPSDWQYVPNGWDSYPEKVKATPLGDDKWEFKYLPNVRDFFGVTDENEEVLQVAVLFRGTNTGSGNPVAVGRGEGGADIYLDLATGEISAKWSSPADEVSVIKPSEEIAFLGLGSANSGTLSLSVFVNNEEVTTVQNDSVAYNFSSTEVGNFDVKLRADNGQGLSDSVTYRVVVFDDTKESRPAGLQDGITYNQDGSISLSLFAPGKQNVFVIGDFNDWKTDFNFSMKKDSLKPDSVWFWITISGLSMGEEYGFQYLIDGSKMIADPYSALLLDPFHDSSIPESVFPNLKPYPVGKTTGLVGLLEPGKEPYEWQSTEYERPDNESLVIYELLVRDFLADHSFSSLIDTLDYLERLGINAIELMPVSEFDGNRSWGYNPASHIALDKYYGTPEKFKEFVDESHKRGIAVILDVVLNHATGAHSLFQLYDFGSNPYFNTSPKHAFNVFNDFNHQYSGTQYYTKKMIEHWITEYNIDGFRWDLTKGFTQNCTSNDAGCTGNYQQDRVDLLKKYADYQWAIDSTFYVIFEHLGTNQEESEWANYRIDEGKGIMLWGNMNGAYNEATMGYHDGGKSNLFGVLSDSRSFERRHLIGYMESHDEQWLMFKNRSFGNSSGDYDVRELNTALGRQKTAGAFFFTLPGPKMIWQFAEVGYGYGDDGEQCLKPGDGSDGDCAPSVADRVGDKPIRWDYWTNPDSQERIKLYKTWAALINLRNSSPVFTNPETALYALSNIVKRITLTHEDTDAVVIGNFGVTTNAPSVDFTKTGTWYDFFDDSEVDVTDVEQSVVLAPGEFKIFTTKKFDAPETGISVSNEINEGGNAPVSFKLYNNYPNPFNPSTNISFDIPKSGIVTLEVFDVVGRKVAELVDGFRVAGTYTVSFDASSLSSGIYFSRLSAGGSVQIQKMTLLK